MRSNTLKHPSRSFEQKKFLPKKSILMVLVNPSGEIDPSILHFLRSNIKVSKPQKGAFVEIVLQEDLVMNLHGVTQGKLRNCVCEIPALDLKATSINNAYTLISEAYEKERRSHGGSAFIKVFFQDNDDFWKPLNVLREKLDDTYDSEIKQNFRTAFDKLRQIDKVEVLSNLMTWAVQDNSEQRAHVSVGGDGHSEQIVKPPIDPS